MQAEVRAAYGQDTACVPALDVRLTPGSGLTLRENAVLHPKLSEVNSK